MQFSWSKSESARTASQPRLYVMANYDEPDPQMISQWRQEGFDVTYLPYLGNVKQFQRQVHQLGDSLGLSEKFAIVGQGLVISLMAL